MNKQQFLEWYNTKVWNLPKDFPRPSQRLVHCDCGKKQCVGHQPCKGWKFEMEKLAKPAKPNGIVHATISLKEKPTWASMFANRNRSQTVRTPCSITKTSPTSVSAPTRTRTKKAEHYK